MAIDWLGWDKMRDDSVIDWAPKRPKSGSAWSSITFNMLSHCRTALHQVFRWVMNSSSSVAMWRTYCYQRWDVIQSEVGNEICNATKEIQIANCSGLWANVKPNININMSIICGKCFGAELSRPCGKTIRFFACVLLWPFQWPRSCTQHMCEHYKERIYTRTYVYWRVRILTSEQCELIANTLNMKTQRGRPFEVRRAFVSICRCP